MKLFQISTLLLLGFLLAIEGCHKKDDPAPLPSISGISPTSGAVSTAVTITGNNFGTDTGKVTVSFNGTAATVQGVTNTEIKTSVPANATTGNIKLSVNG